MEFDFKKLGMSIFLLIFISSFTIATGLLLYVASHDYLMVELYDQSVTLANDGIIISEVPGLVEDFITGAFQTFPQQVDRIWFGTFLAFVISLWVSSYYSNREGLLSIFTFLTYGIMIVLFLSTIYITLSDWYYDLIVNQALANLSYEGFYFNFYLNNIGIINMLIMAVALFLNFVDLDTIKNATRKNREIINDEP